MNLFFDLDGTLIDSKQRLYRLFIYLNPKLNISFEQYWEFKKKKISHKEILVRFYGYTNQEYLFFQNLWMNQIEKIEWLKYDKPFNGLEIVLSALSEKNSLYLVTARQSKIALAEQLKFFGILDYFKLVLVTEQKFEKFDLIVKNVNVSSEDYIIGDTGKDIETGRRLSIKTIAVLSGFLSKSSLLTYKPDFIIDDVTKLISNENTFFEF
jgi:phosphoglycolate phosphatase